MNLKFEQPAWLIAIALVPLFVIGALLTSKLRRKQWAAFVSPRLRPKLLRRGSPVPRWLAFSFLMVAFILLAFTLARPQTTQGKESETTRGRNVLIALDLSRSMMAKDLKPDRLTQAKALCNELIDAMPTDRVGVVGFAGEPYLFAPLTVDHASVLETIDQLDPDSIPVQGSNLYGALKLAIKTLKETGQKENALIILTDGEETTEKMISLATEAKKSGLYVFAVAFGTEQGDFIPDARMADGHHRDKNGHPVITKLSTESLQVLTRETGGRFVVATSASDIPAMVVAAIKDLEQFEIAGRERIVPTEHFQWFLLPAIILLMGSIVAGTRWRSLAPVGVAALVFLMPSPAKAGVDAYGTQLMKEGKYKEAAAAFSALATLGHESGDSFRFRLGEGTALYHAGDMAGARRAFSEALRSSDSGVKAAAHHGLGNVLFQSGWRSLSDDMPYPETYKPQLPGIGGVFDKILDTLLGRHPQGRADKDSHDPMAPFDEMVTNRVMEWLKEDVEEGTEAKGYGLFDSVVTDWIDAVKHYDSAISYDPALEDAKSNRALTVKYLKRLEDLLNQVQENAKMMGGNGGQGDDEGEGDEGNGGQGGNGQGAPGGSGPGGKRRHHKGKGGDQQDRQGKDGPGEDKDKDKKGKGGDKDNKDGAGKPKKGESPEDTAKRILRENADFEKGAPTKGRIDYEQPEKDW
jgi:Ca-activated chloride channel family protein